MNRYLLIAWCAGMAGVSVARAQTAGSRFVPVIPCRVADTRNPNGPFGGPTPAAGSVRSFPIPQSGCNIPATAQAYSLNVTVVPAGVLSYLTLWPTGQPQPLVSTLNSFGGTVVANAAIVPAGSGGAVSVFVSNPTDVILDINGYFDSTGSVTSYSFYPATPCRVADTRGLTGPFGGPSLSANQTREFAIPAATCGMPAAATAYSLNITAVPDTSYLGYLSTWPTGSSQPFVSTLNSWTGKVVANAALVPAGTNGSISVFVTDPTDAILDINGYFGGAGGTGELALYPVAPCRVADTRNANGPFGGPEMGTGSTRSFAIPASGCSVPSTAAAYSLNVTVVPDGALSYLSAWPTGSAQPFVSTLNSFDGAVVANAAIVPAGTNGAISIYTTNPTHVILDINGYFGPPPAPTPTPTPLPTITSVTVSCPNPIVALGGKEQCTATVQGTGNFSTAVNWSASAGTISATGAFVAPSAAGAVTITATSAADPTKAGSAAVKVAANQSGFGFNGITFVSWWNGEYSGGSATIAEDALASTGSTWAGVLVTQYMPTCSSNTIGVTSQTPTDSDVMAAIAGFHAQGVQVMLKPHVDVTNTTSTCSWRGQITPTDTNAWFQSYTTFITHYATIAKNNGVEMLCIGTELATMTGYANQSLWNNVIAAIRGTGYTGKLTYAANATSATDEFTKVSFWDNPEMDLMGLDAYFPLTDHADPTLAQLVAAWSSNRWGEHIVQDVLNFSAAHNGKPVIFTEIGYRSFGGANMAPWDYSNSGAADQSEQMNCYEAMYEVWSQHNAVMLGNFWWAWSITPPNVATDTDYTPWNKSAQGVLQVWQ